MKQERREMPALRDLLELQSLFEPEVDEGEPNTLQLIVEDSTATEYPSAPASRSNYWSMTSCTSTERSIKLALEIRVEVTTPAAISVAAAGFEDAE